MAEIQKVNGLVVPTNEEPFDLTHLMVRNYEAGFHEGYRRAQADEHRRWLELFGLAENGDPL